MNTVENDLCGCGCGQPVSRKGNRFINGHNTRLRTGENNPMYGKVGCWRGKKRSVEAREKMSKSRIDRGTGEGTPFYGKKHTEEAKKRQSDTKKGENHPMYGKRGEVTNGWKGGKEKFACKQCGGIAEDYGWRNRKYCSKECEYTDRSERFSGENSPSWRGGKSFEPYPPEFNGRLKRFIRDRDDQTCQKCGKTEEEGDRNLDVHHVDYNKENNSKDNLVALCQSCNGKVNARKNYWVEYFQKLIRSNMNDYI